MSDLISRSMLLSSMNKRYNEKCNIVPDNLAEGFMQMEKLIKEQPTAYSVEKVVEELEELEVKSITRYNNGDFGDFDGVDYYIKKSESIEIIKQGGGGVDE